MSIKVVEYLVTKTRYSFLTRIPEGENMVNIKTNTREYIFNSDSGSNTKKIENRFYPRFVFLLQIMLVALQSSHTVLLAGGLTQILFISGQNLKIKQTHSICRSGFSLYKLTIPDHTGFWKEMVTKNLRKVSSVMVMTVTPNTKNVTLLIVLAS